MFAADFKKKKNLVLLYILAVIGATAIAVCVYNAVQEIFTNYQAQSYYTAVSDISGDLTSTLSEILTTNVDDRQAEEQPMDERLFLIPDFAALKISTPDIKAWLSCENTLIDFPVVQGEDNDYYLHRLPNGESSVLGSIFMDYRHNEDFSDQNILIFGHHIKKGLMFGSLVNYKDQTYYEEHPLMMFYTPGKAYEIELFAGYVLDANHEIPPLNFKNEEDFDKYITELRNRSTFKSEIEPIFGDKLISLCTCDYTFPDARFLVVGKLTEIK
jgi:sortase B